MDSSNGQHNHQEMSSQTLESMLACTKSQQEKKPRPADMQALKCPRCDSTNTKFCYYNNYSLSQPRYFCKSCRRYWTKGGTLRNVPVGGGCRKNRRSSSSSSSSSSSKRTGHDQAIPTPIPSLSANNHLPYDSNDLSLAIARLQKQSNCGQLGMIMDDHHDFSIWANHNMAAHHGGLGMSSTSSAFDGLRIGGGGFLENPAGPSGGGSLGNLYYGSLEMGMSGAPEEMGIPFEDFSVGTTTASTAVTTVKQEVRGGGESRVLWGFPWQGIGSGGDGNGADLDSSRSMGWNGIGSGNWHGLLNSPLM